MPPTGVFRKKTPEDVLSENPPDAGSDDQVPPNNNGDGNEEGVDEPICPMHRLSTHNEASGPKYRKVGLNGFPLADEKPQAESESDVEKEETYVDALTLRFRHDTTDIHIPLVGEELALSVRRSAASEVWSSHPGLRPDQHWDRPFGMGWRSGLTANIKFHVRSDGVLTSSSPNCPSEAPEPNYVWVTDENGTEHRFVTVDKAGETRTYLPMPSNRSEQDEFLLSLEEQANAFLFTRQFGTTLKFEKPTGSITASYTLPGTSDSHTYTYSRLLEVTDRFDNRLVYQYSGMPNSLIPDRIVGVSDSTVGPSELQNARTGFGKIPRDHHQ